MEPPSSSRIRVSSTSGLPPIPRKAIIAAALACDPTGDVNIHLGMDGEVREQNKLHRQMDCATDVLSFEGPKFPGAPLGDILISHDTASRQAKARRVSTRSELSYLTIHGVLHLLGWNDEEEADRRAMWDEMARIGALLKLPNVGDWTSLEVHE